jgi:hypothetical protein
MLGRILLNTHVLLVPNQSGVEWVLRVVRLLF